MYQRSSYVHQATVLTIGSECPHAMAPACTAGEPLDERCDRRARFDAKARQIKPHDTCLPEDDRAVRILDMLRQAKAILARVPALRAQIMAIPDSRSQIPPFERRGWAGGAMQVDFDRGAGR